MKNFLYPISLLFIFLFLTACNDDEMEAWEMEVASVRQATSTYSNFDAAIAAGYDTDVSGYVAQMGHHYLNGALVDDVFEAEKPEVLLFAPDANDNMVLVAVEYVVPIADLDNPPPAPEGFTGDKDVWEINPNTSLWTLHLWLRLENPDGIFDSTNPLLQ